MDQLDGALRKSSRKQVEDCFSQLPRLLVYDWMHERTHTQRLKPKDLSFLHDDWYKDRYAQFEDSFWLHVLQLRTMVDQKLPIDKQTFVALTKSHGLQVRVNMLVNWDLRDLEKEIRPAPHLAEQYAAWKDALVSAIDQMKDSYWTNELFAMTGPDDVHSFCRTIGLCVRYRNIESARRCFEHIQTFPVHVDPTDAKPQFVMALLSRVCCYEDIDFVNEVVQWLQQCGFTRPVIIATYLYYRCHFVPGWTNRYIMAEEGDWAACESDNRLLTWMTYGTQIIVPYEFVRHKQMTTNTLLLLRERIKRADPKSDSYFHECCPDASEWVEAEVLARELVDTNAPLPLHHMLAEFMTNERTDIDAEILSIVSSYCISSATVPERTMVRLHKMCIQNSSCRKRKRTLD